ncbi:tyrosine-type recombinase/integrase [Nonomuraea sp. NPDC005501]|uniref:tyrosine-type recombinase/integrase n=1 Tax=Nonomuraea sp. NPDC005501 TaxID=3156884 RepID=UPI0033B73E9D
MRERTLFRLLYESAARAEEVLALDVADLDLRNRRARVRRKGGAVDVIVWQTPTARLLPRLLDGRRAGPVFLTGRRARVALPPSDVDAAPAEPGCPTAGLPSCSRPRPPIRPAARGRCTSYATAP